MKIPSSSTLKATARGRLEKADQAGRIVLIYAGILLGFSALATLVSFLLDHQIAQAGGLHNLGMRSMLSALQSVFPVIQAVLQLCLDLGLISAMLRIARGQYASPQSLRMGLDRFGVLLRSTLLQGLIYFSAAFLSVYAALAIFMVTPLSDSAMTILIPLATSTSVLSTGQVTIDDATAAALIPTMIPFFVLYAIVFLAVFLPIAYRFRMVRYLLIDKPGNGALYAMRTSRQMMKGNCMALLRVDLSFWWYYLLLAVAACLCYPELFLPALGVSLPIPEDILYFGFYLLYLGALLAIYYRFRSYVETAYAAAYDAICPKENPDGGVVLGSIFQR